MHHQLQITSDGGERSTHPLRTERVSLGRARDNDLSYPEDSGLSRHHLALEQAAGRWWVRDLGSKNGTIVNDRRIEDRVPLNPGDQIRASRLNLVFEPVGGDPLMGTVVFDPAREQADQSPMHTVTLGQLVTADPGAGPPMDASAQWADPVQVLMRAGREMVARKPMAELFADILNLSLEAVGASRGVLLTLEDGELIPKAIRGKEFHISSAVRDRVMKERTSLLVGDVGSDEALRGRESIVLQRVRSLLAAPLQTDERVLGLVYVDTPHAWRQFSPADLNLLTVMANVAAMRIERERLAAVEKEREIMERELDQAAEIQRQFLPAQAPSVPGFDLAGYNAPCYGVGGDYYDFVAYPDGSVLLALGDVAGKGMSAALLMVNLQARVQMLAEHPATPAEMVGALNRALHTVCPSNRFVTFFVALMSAENGLVSFCNAGHNPPFLIRAGGEWEALDAGGPVLGILPKMVFRGETAVLGPGDSLVVYSDGVTEATNPAGEEFGEERLQQILIRNRHLSANELIEEINRELTAFVGGAPTADDVTIVVARRMTG